MAGINPGMIIKVAADIRDAVEALGQVVEATSDVDASAQDVNKSFDALDVAIGTFAANAATEIFKLAFGAVQDLAGEIWDVVEAALGLSDAYKAFKGDITEVIRESGVLKAGFDSLETSFLAAFGGTRAEAVQAIADLIALGAIKTLEFSADLITLGEYGVRAMAALIIPIDAVLFVIGELATRWVEFTTNLLDMAAQIPFVGSKYEGLAAQARAMGEATRDWTDNTYNQMAAHQELVNGGGAFLAWTGTAKAEIRDAAAAMTEQRTAAAAATTGLHELTDANAGLVLGTGEAVVALYNQNKALEDMDDWSRAIKNTDPYAYLKQGMEKTLPPLVTMKTEMLSAGVVMKDTGQHAIEMSDDVKFAAEVVQRASVTWSEAMELVRQGQGTMTGTIGPATRPAGISDSEWALMQNDPRQWEATHGYDWDAPHAGTASAWSMGGSTTTAGGTTVNQSVTVNTVAGDKQAIATVVKDALASDWRSAGLRG